MTITEEEFNIFKNMKITEEQLNNLFTEKWGSNPEGRVLALDEELEEFTEAWLKYKLSIEDKEGMDIQTNRFEHCRDEAADLFSVALHLIHTVGLTAEDAIQMTWDKIKTRETDPEYKKDWL